MTKGFAWLFESRGRLLLVALLILAALDIARSIYARIGYAEAAEPWQDAPYQGLQWPPGAEIEQSASTGERVYLKRCAICHGSTGQGDGPAAPSQIPRPRDFTVGEYKYKTTAAGESPTEEDLIATISNGLHASAMPYWDDVLSEQETAEVARHILSLSLFHDEGPAPRAITIPPRVPPDGSSLVRGEMLFEKSCAECHEMSGRGDVRAQDRKDEYPVPTRDLTAPWTFRGGSDPADLWLRLTTGMRPGPMPDYADTLTADERWDIVNYTLSLARTPPWEPGGRLDGPGQHKDLQKRGEYIVHTEMCGLCHTQVNADLIYSGDDYYLAGGMGIPIYPHGTYVSRNLTPDVETGLGSWTTDEIATAIRTGQTPERGLNFWGMPWQFLHSIEHDDALAIATYLKSRPPVTNEIPDPLRFGYLETVVAKIIYSDGVPPIANPVALIYRMGNFGRTQPQALPRHWLQDVLVFSQWFVLGAGVIGLFFAGSVDTRWSSRHLGWIRYLLVSGGIGIVGLISWVYYATPVLWFVPPAQINQAVAGSIHTPAPDQLNSPELAALAERGRYLFAVTSCAFCHNNDGSGGAKINMSAFGSVWVRNITPDEETGIGGWTDAEIARAIRSGVSRDGSVLHWQGMVWDHLSNLDEEDVRALLVYLRTIPAIRNEVPAPVPPGPDDCPEYTFHLTAEPVSCATLAIPFSWAR